MTLSVVQKRRHFSDKHKVMLICLYSSNITKLKLLAEQTWLEVHSCAPWCVGGKAATINHFLYQLSLDYFIDFIFI